MTEETKTLTLTAEEIRDLAWFAGFKVDTLDKELDTEYSIYAVPEAVPEPEGEPENNHWVGNYNHVVFITENLDAGPCPLGAERLQTQA